MRERHAAFQTRDILNGVPVRECESGTQSKDPYHSNSTHTHGVKSKARRPKPEA